MTTPLHSNSKSDTIVLLDAGAADIFVDHGPERTNLADQTTYADEDPSARAAIGAPRNITIKLRMRSGSSGVLLELGDGVDYSYRVSLSTGELSFAEAGLLRARVTVPGLSGADSVILVNWSQRVEAGAVVDEVAVGNLDTEEWAFATGSHSAATPDPAHALTVAASYGGSDLYSGEIGAVLAVHVGRRFHAATEAWEDWGTASTPPTFEGYPRAPILTGAASELGIAGEGSLAGPSLLWAGAATRQAAQRGVGSLVNLVINDPATERLAPNPARFYRKTPDGWGSWCVRYLWHGFIGPTVNVAQVRVHVRAFDNGGGGTISPVRLRSYSVADLPLNGAPPAPLTYHRGAVTSLTSPSAAGVWVDLGVVQLAREPSGLSYFCLGFLIDADADEGVLFDTAWQLNAITVDPFAKDLTGGGLGDFDLEAP